jgi:aminocarboxymuconate-semialdehyde decarboxylase
MEFVISMVGADRVMIGSDYCFDMGYEQPSPSSKRSILAPKSGE